MPRLFSKTVCLTLLGISLLTPSVALARDGSDSSRLLPRKEMFERIIRNASEAAERKVTLLQFKDQRRAELATKINAELNSINQKSTDQMSIRVEKMNDIYNKLNQRVNASTASARSTDVQAAMTKAENDIQLAQSAIAAQKSKDYSLGTITDGTAKAQLTQKRDQLRADLKATNQTLITAKQDLAKAISLYAQTKGAQL